MEPFLFVAALAFAWYLNRGDSVGVSASVTSNAEQVPGSDKPAPTPGGVSTAAPTLTSDPAQSGATKGGGKGGGKAAKQTTTAALGPRLANYEPDPVVSTGKTSQALPAKKPRPNEVFR